VTPKPHLDRFSRFCTVHPSTQSTQTRARIYALSSGGRRAAKKLKHGRRRTWLNVLSIDDLSVLADVTEGCGDTEVVSAAAAAAVSEAAGQAVLLLLHHCVRHTVLPRVNNCLLCIARCPSGLAATDCGIAR